MVKMNEVEEEGQRANGHFCVTDAHSLRHKNNFLQAAQHDTAAIHQVI